MAVRQASGSILTNKYSEGYPGKRYYAGNEWVDAAEALAIQRVKELFGAEHANVQPHAGSQANMAAYFATLNPGDTVLAMELAQGGHLTHGAGFNFSGKLYRFPFESSRGIRSLAIKARYLRGEMEHLRLREFQPGLCRYVERADQAV